jgi:hypothetical protein
VGSRCIRPDSDDVAGGVDPSGRGPGGPREVDPREGAAAADESVLDAGGVEVGPAREVNAVVGEVALPGSKMNPPTAVVLSLSNTSDSAAPG